MVLRFSGHETFPCRYAWLPKAYAAIREDPKQLADDERAMIRLGLGKNMVRACRFWLQAAGIATGSRDGTMLPTPFGDSLLSRRGLDPFLEDIKTLWLIHWQLSSHTDEPLFAWDFLLNRWQQPEIARSTVVDVFRREARQMGRELSDVTLEQHFDVFLHTYVATRGRKGEVQEDNLDSPLVELELIHRVGERRLEESDKREPIYAFRRDAKPEITPELFAYCLADFWDRRHVGEKTLSFREIAVGHGSPGQVFKLPEPDVRERLDVIEADTHGWFAYKESASLQQVVRGERPKQEPLALVYEGDVVYA